MEIAKKLICSECSKEYSMSEIQSFCTDCAKPLIVDYNLNQNYTYSSLPQLNSMWRYADLMPIQNRSKIVSLGEGQTPILPLDRISTQYGFSSLKLKDEGLNPTGSFKARGLSAAISKANELGITDCIIPTAGNAGGALSAYCARAGMTATVVMPSHTPKAFQNECRDLGAKVILVKGLINDCGKEVQRIKAETGAYDVSTLKEPYRIEGKKTMGYEIAEQYNFNLPDVILYPTGGGTGLIGIWKAFQEMKQLGWLTGKLPKMIAVQSANCTPVVDTFFNHLEPKPYKESLANGLAVPVAFGMNLILKTLNESKGTAIAVTETELIAKSLEIHKAEGIYVAPEGGALLSALIQLRDQKLISSDDDVLLLNTGNGYKYAENFDL